MVERTDRAIYYALIDLGLPSHDTTNALIDLFHAHMLPREQYLLELISSHVRNSFQMLP